MEDIIMENKNQISKEEFTNIREDEIEHAARNLLIKRGVTVEDIIPLVYFLQKDHIPNLTNEEIRIHVEQVLTKREVHNAILTGIELDILAEKRLLSEPLLEIVQKDEGLYGVDEVLALSIVNIYGSIGFTNYGYIDRVKPGILAQLNNKNKEHVHTFLDDIVGAIAAASASRLAHTYKKKIDQNQ